MDRTYGKILAWNITDLAYGFRIVSFTEGLMYDTEISVQTMKTVMLPLRYITEIRQEIAFNTINISVLFLNGNSVDFTMPAADFSKWIDILTELKELTR